MNGNRAIPALPAYIDDPLYEERFYHERLEDPDWRRFYGIVRKPKHVLYVPTPVYTIAIMLTLAEPRPGETLIDLGAGDGRVPIIAAREYGAITSGYELRPELYKRFVENIELFKVTESVTAFNTDFFASSLAGADVITCYLCEDLLEEVAEKLMKERPQRPLRRVISYWYPLPGQSPVRVHNVEPFGANTYLYHL